MEDNRQTTHVRFRGRHDDVYQLWQAIAAGNPEKTDIRKKDDTYIGVYRKDFEQFKACGHGGIIPFHPLAYEDNGSLELRFSFDGKKKLDIDMMIAGDRELMQLDLYKKFIANNVSGITKIMKKYKIRDLSSTPTKNTAKPA